MCDFKQANGLTGGSGFDPEGGDYDYATARARGMGPAGSEAGENMGHWPSRDPETGMILKGRRHPTFDLAIEEDAKLGYRMKKKDGRYFTEKDQP